MYRNEGYDLSEAAGRSVANVGAKAAFSVAYTKGGTALGTRIGGNFGQYGASIGAAAGCAIGFLADAFTTDQVVDAINDFLYEVAVNYDDYLICK